MILSDIIAEKISQNGPISFHDFMEAALYYPDLGYYTSEKQNIGKMGDYYTSPHCTCLFGYLIAKQLEEMWDIIGQGTFSIVEFGGGEGLLAHDILQYIKLNNLLFYNNVKYYIIEKHPMPNNNLQNKENEKVVWYNAVNDVPNITGCVLSNELLDNFPVHKVIMLDTLMEVFIDHDADGFKEILRPAFNGLKDYFIELGISLPYGFQTEVNLQAIQWVKKISNFLDKGFVLTIDYGFSSEDLYSEGRRNGTLVCYNKHNLNDNPYNYIGNQDITAHVNFSALKHWGVKFGLNQCGFTNQTNFLRGLGITDLLRNYEKEISLNENQKRFLSLHFLLNSGSKFKVLIQSKNIITKPFLSGLSFHGYL